LASQTLTFQPIKATIVLPTEKRLVVSFWTFFKYLGEQGELRKTEITKNIC